MASTVTQSHPEPQHADAAGLPAFSLGLDLDQTTAQWVPAMRTWLAAHRGVELERIPDAHSYDLIAVGWFADAAEQRQLMAAAHDSGVLRGLKPFDGALDALRRLSLAGVQIDVITSRDVGAAYEADTEHWLAACALPHRSLTFASDKSTVRADVYVDDSPSVIAALRRAGREVIAFDQPYNRHVAGPRACNWAGLETMVMRRYRMWAESDSRVLAAAG